MPLTIALSVDLATEFRIVPLELFKSTHALTIAFEDGDHVYTSPEFELGVIRAVHNRPLIGCITFRYQYDAENRTITVCDTDYPSASTMALVTFPKDMPQHSCVERSVAGSGFAADDVSPGSFWNPHTSLMSGAADALRQIVRATNESLITSLRALPDTHVRVRALPPAVGDDLENYVVLKDGALVGRYSDFATQQIIAGEGVVVAGLDSTIGGKYYFYKYANFANVIGSTHDPKHGWPSWISIWQYYFGTAMDCSSLHFPNNYPCTNSPILHGGHIVQGVVPVSLPQGSDAAFIIPICPAHNHDNNVHMAAITNGAAVWLKNYFL